MRNFAIRLITVRAIMALTTVAWLQPAFGDSGPSHQHGRSHAAPGFSAGQPGDPRKPARIVPVTMRETADGRMIYEPARLKVKKGEQVRFVLTNAGELEHEFVLASREDNVRHAEEMRANPDMKHDEPNGRMLAPKAKGEIVWRFTEAGTFEYSCLIPGHREAGMTGVVTVR